MMQLALFDDDLPLPLIASRRWNFSQQYHVVEGAHLYSPVDWIAGLIGVASASQTWRNIERNNDGVFSKHTLPYIASDGKTYPMDFVTDKGLYWITQHLRIKAGREALKEIRQYLAEAGAFVDAIRRDPEGAAAMLQDVAERRAAQKLMIKDGMNRDEAYQYVKVRAKSKARRSSTTDNWKVRGVKSQNEYISLSNAVMKVAIGQTATEFKRDNRIPAKVSAREYMSAADLATVSFVEWASDMLSISRDSHGAGEIRQDIFDTKPMVETMRPEIEAALSSRPRRLPAPKGKQLQLGNGQ